MTVKEFIEQLQKMPQDATVVTTCDYGYAIIKGIKHLEKLEDVIDGYLCNSIEIENVVYVNVNTND